MWWYTGRWKRDRRFAQLQRLQRRHRFAQRAIFEQPPPPVKPCSRRTNMKIDALRRPRPVSGTGHLQDVSIADILSSLPS